MNIIAYRNYCDIPYLRENIIKNSNSDRKISPENFKHLIKQIQSGDFNEEICNSRMKECSEPTELEYGFCYTTSDGTEHDIVYKISFTNYIINEELRCCNSDTVLRNAPAISPIISKISAKSVIIFPQYRWNDITDALSDII